MTKMVEDLGHASLSKDEFVLTAKEIFRIVIGMFWVKKKWAQC